jgi:hypothetical protein
MNIDRMRGVTWGSLVVATSEQGEKHLSGFGSFGQSLLQFSLDSMRTIFASACGEKRKETEQQEVEDMRRKESQDTQLTEGLCMKRESKGRNA